MNHLRVIARTMSACSFIIVAVSVAQAQNIVQNSDFSAPAVSSTDFPDWTVNLTTGAPGVYTGLDLGPNSTGAANWITVSPYNYEGNGQISQVLNTTAGTTYTISFTAATNNTQSGGNRLAQILWGGSLLLDFTDGFTANNTLTTFTAQAEATSNMTTLMFQGFQNSGWWDVSTVSVTATPEPSSMAAMSGLLGLGLFAARRRRSK